MKNNLKLILGLAGVIFYTIGILSTLFIIVAILLTNLQIYWGCESGDCGWLSYADMDLSGIKPIMPYWASFVTWIIGIGIMLLLLFSGKKCM